MTVISLCLSCTSTEQSELSVIMATLNTSSSYNQTAVTPEFYALESEQPQIEDCEEVDFAHLVQGDHVGPASDGHGFDLNDAAEIE